jgi:uncharacterized protein (TIGR02246 family)
MSPVNTSDDEHAIRILIDRWLKATAAGDTEAVLRLMADDVLFLVAGRDPFGKAEFAANSKQLAGARIDAHSEIRELEVAGSWAWCRTELTVEIAPPSGPTQRRSGPTLSVLRKQPDGQWVFLRDANFLRDA